MGVEENAGEMGVAQEALAGNNEGGENLGGTNVVGSNVGGTNIGGANLGGTNVSGVNVGGANVGGTNLGGNNLGGNNIGGTNIGGANINGTNIGGTNVSGTNVSGTNVGGSNLGGSNLAGAYSGSGCPVTGTYRLGTDLSLSTVGIDIHNLGAAAANKLTRSGEDAYTKVNSCVVFGIGSKAFSKLVNQNLSGTTMYAALRALPWGFTSTSGGAVSLTAWEVVVWGSSKYSVFIIAAPTTSTWAGVAGFVKAVFRWNAPPTMTIKIGQIGGGQTVQSHSGMMNAQSHLLAGLVDEQKHIAGELAFVQATTNNVSVMVDFASWIGKTGTNDPIILGRPEGALLRPDGVYSVLQLDDGSIGSYVSKFNQDFDDGVTQVNAWKAGVAGKPSAKRCFAAVSLSRTFPADYPLPTGKCDTFALNSAIYNLELPDLSANGASYWGAFNSREGQMLRESPNGVGDMKERVPVGTLGCTTSSPSYVSAYAHCKFLILSQTYVHVNEAPYTIAGEGAHVNFSGNAMHALTGGMTMSRNISVTNVGTVPGTTWTLEVPTASYMTWSPATTTISGLAVGAVRTVTLTGVLNANATTGFVPVTFQVKKGTTVLSKHVLTVVPTTTPTE